MLSQGPVSVDHFREILDAVHQEGPYQTQYSFIADLKTRTIHLYQYHDFDNAVVFNLDQELDKGRRVYRIKDLFKEDPQSSINQTLFFNLVQPTTISGYEVYLFTANRIK